MPFCADKKRLYNAPAKPATVMDALMQRLEKYKATAEQAKEDGESSKARRMTRMVKVSHQTSSNITPAMFQHHSLQPSTFIHHHTHGPSTFIQHHTLQSSTFSRHHTYRPSTIIQHHTHQPSTFIRHYTCHSSHQP